MEFFIPTFIVAAVILLASFITYHVSSNPIVKGICYGAEVASFAVLIVIFGVSFL